MGMSRENWVLSRLTSCRRCTDMRAIGTNDMGHWSNCAINNEPAYPADVCDCGGLDLAAYDRYCRIVGIVPTPRSLAGFIRNGICPSLIKAEELPAGGLTADAPTADLPSSQNRIAVPSGADSVNLDQSGKAVIADSEAPACIQRIAGHMPPHLLSPPNRDEGRMP